MQYTLRLTSIVPATSNNFTLLDELCRRFTYKNKDHWKDKLSEGEILINGNTPASNHILKSGDKIEFVIPDFEEPDIDTNYIKVWENNHLILVNKPAGLPVQSNKRFYFQTMTATIRRNEQNNSLNPLHRLDRETSGLMFYVKTKYAHKRLQKQFKHFLEQKFYLCIVRGKVNETAFTVSISLAEAKKPPVNYKMLPNCTGKLARTDFYKLDENKDYCLLIAQLHTGRKHQIRAHLEHIGCPIIGDKLYSFESKYFLKRCNDNLQNTDLAILGASNQLLHSFAVKINIPGETNSRIFFSFNLSEEFEKWLQLFPNWQAKAKALVNNISKIKRSSE